MGVVQVMGMLDETGWYGCGVVMHPVGHKKVQIVTINLGCTFMGVRETAPSVDSAIAYTSVANDGLISTKQRPGST